MTPASSPRRWPARLLLLLAALLPARPAGAEADPLADALTRARTREAIGVERSETAQARARTQALAAYRLARRRAATFLADPRGRADNARALGAALLVLAREASEAAVFRAELAQARHDRAGLESAGATSATTTADRLHDGDLLLSPVRGTRVRGPGLRRDDATLALLREEGVRILSRLHEPVRAPAAARVHKVAPRARGGFALVLEHGDGLVSILSGLRQVDVVEGAPVERGQRVGLVGRDIDGAPVVSLELWQRGRPIDPTAHLSP